MTMVDGRVIFLVILHIGLSHAASPLIVNKSEHDDYASFPENYSGTVFRLHITDSDAGDSIAVGADDDITSQYFNIIQTPKAGNDVFVNVTVNNTLDRENPSIGTAVKVNLKITDSQTNMVTYQFTVYVNDVNDNAPKFKNLPYKLDIDELPCNKTTVFTEIHATDADINDNGRVSYSMLPKAQSAETRKLYNETFSIDSSTGQVTLKKCLDYESNSYYQFTITAKDQGPDGGLNATAEFIIRVKDVQDEPPVFEGVPYFKTIREDIANGTELLTVKARDGDPGVSDKVYFSITNSSCGMELFDINKENGSITVASTIDRDKGSVHNNSGNCIITVQASEIDNGLTKQFGNITAFINATINVQDVDDNRPKFNNATYQASVPENTPEDAPISITSVVTVSDRDQGGNALIRLALNNLDGSPCEDFVASPSEIQGSGNVKILVKNSTKLDYETLKNIKIKIVATGVEHPYMSAVASVNITILDRNDNSPQFNQTTFAIDVKENTSNGTIIGTITAKDADTKYDYKTVQYSLSGGSGRFTVDKYDGSIRTKCTNCSDQLDREKRSDYYMTLFGTDLGGNRNSTEVVVTLTDVNDNKPTFSRPIYTSYIEENNQIEIVKLEAADRDDPNTNNSRFTFSIISSSDTEFRKNLTITETTGNIKLTTPVDYEALQNMSGMVEITVEVKDHGQPVLSSTSVVTLTVQDKNDNRPVFNQTVYNGSVKEDASSNSTYKTNIALVYATDRDGTDQNKELSYFKTEGSDKFTIDPSTGVVSVRMNAELDRETVQDYNLTIIAIDQGSPPKTGTTTVSIVVTDVNDEKPQFDKHQYAASVKENITAENSIVYRCSASDKDHDKNLTYSINAVEAFDENGDLVNKTLNYFGIDHIKGSVYVTATLDRETAETVTLHIGVTDENAVHNTPQTDNATLTVTLLDVNDNHPVFDKTQYNISVAEDAGKGRKYDGPTATDRDENRTITYILVNGPSPIDSFKIENTTGTLIKIGEIDREENSSIKLHVVAVDNGVPSLNSNVEVTVTVLDANDNPPKFTNSSLDIKSMNIMENVENGTELVDVNATDIDSGPDNNNITYYLEDNDYFGIDATTGVISVTKSPDREVSSQVVLTIIGKDNPLQKKSQKTSSMTMTVSIDDANDNKPTFARNYTQSIEEDKAVGSTILQVTATDIDKPNTNNSKISYRLDNSYDNKFSIDGNTGEIKINSSLIDHVGNYTLEVISYDHGKSPKNGTTYVVIRVTDKNRHPPVIGNLPEGNEMKIYECAVKDTVIHKFNYTDGDFGVNAQASFNVSILQDNITGIFELTEDGELKVVGKLDVNIKQSYRFGIMASDHGTPQLSSDVIKITVTLMDVNDHMPSFSSTKVTWSLKENTTYEDSIGEVIAYDADTDSEICYNIDKRWETYFSVNASNNQGDVFSHRKLDHEENTTVSFTVHVSDCSIQKNISNYCNKTGNNKIMKVKEATNATINVTIDVVDIDDSPPVFREKQLATGMRRNTEADTELELHLRNETYISDADTPQNGVLSWKFSNYGNITVSPELQEKIQINSGARPCDDNINHIFCVTRNGTIINNKFFSEDLSGYFILTVKVEDNGGYDIANITIYLISDSQVVTMTLRQNKERVAQQKDDLLASLSRILGYTAVFDSLQDHKENGEINTYSSDLRFHIVEKTTKAVLSGKDAINLFDKQANNGEMIALQNRYNVINVAQKSMTDSGEETSSTRLTFILIAVSVAEAIIISLTIFVALSARNKFRRKLKAAVINTPDMEMHVHGQKEVAIPGSNLYSKQNNPLLNASIQQKVQESNLDNDSMTSSEDLNLDENVVDDPHTLYDKIEEKEVTLDMYTDDTAQHNVSSEDLLGAALHHHALRKSRESLDKIDGDDDSSARYGGPTTPAAAFINESYMEDFESTEI